MSRSGRSTVLTALVLILAACAPNQPSSRDSAPAAGPSSGALAAPKSLSLAIENEPTDPFIGSLGTGSGTIAANLRLAVHQELANYDDRGGLSPMLAIELPTQERGTWVVRSNGTMQTTYQLRPGVTWHDGTALTARDFVLGWQAMKDPELPMSRRGLSPQIASIETPDDNTLLIEWSRTYPFANAIVGDDIGPFPVHLVGSIYETDKDRFGQLPYWTREFVGIGPYRLSSWEAGSHLVLTAYERFHSGRAKIDTIVVRFMSNAPTIVANLLSGAIDGAIPRALDFTQVAFVRDEWERAGRKPVAIVQATHWRILEPQFRDPKPAEILDIRLRRALLHAIDRQAMVDTLLTGSGIPLSESFIFPTDVKYEWVKDAIIHYPYDKRRAQELLTELGWRMGADGQWFTASGDGVTIGLETSAGEQSEQEQAIIGADWHAIGLNVDLKVRTAAEARDNRLNSIFPGFSASAAPLTFENTTMRLHATSCPTEAKRWAGPNHGCYESPQMDSLIDSLQQAINPSEQQRLYRDLIKWQTDQLPVYPLYYNPQAVIFREGITGVRGDTQPRTAPTWNVASWDIN